MSNLNLHKQSMDKVLSILLLLYSWVAGRLGPKSDEQQSENWQTWDLWLFMNERSVMLSQSYLLQSQHFSLRNVLKLITNVWRGL